MLYVTMLNCLTWETLTLVANHKERSQRHLLLPPYGKKDTFMFMGPTCKLFYDITKKK